MPRPLSDGQGRLATDPLAMILVAHETGFTDPTASDLFGNTQLVGSTVPDHG
jgi:hypothetical protein